MLNPTIRDVQYRKARFVLAILGVSLLFMLILIMDGIATGMKNWTIQYLKDTKADAWAIQSDTEGPFTGYSIMPENTVDKMKKIEGVKRADPLILTMQNTKVGGANERIYLIGHKSDSIVEPKKLKEGRQIKGEKEAVVDESLKIKIGKKLKIAGQSLKVVGKSKNTTYTFNTPIVFVSLKDAQEILYNKQSVVNTVALHKESGYSLSSTLNEVNDLKRVDTKTQSKMLDDVLKQVDEPMGAISFLRNIFWMVGALIISMIVYVTAVERTQDFAVFKAIGATNGYVTRQVLSQALLISIIAALVGSGLAVLLAPAFPIKMTIQTATLISTPLIAIVVSALSSLAAIRKAISVDPVVAFGGK